MVDPRPIEEGQIWRVLETGKLVRVRLFRWSDFGPQIEVENIEDVSERGIWTPEDFIQHCEHCPQ